jgi:hypothetical protein
MLIVSLFLVSLVRVPHSGASGARTDDWSYRNGMRGLFVTRHEKKDSGC